MKQTFRTATALACTLLLAGVAAVASDGGKGNTDTRLKTKLAGAAIAGKTPEGSADFRMDSKGRTRLQVEVENVNLAAATVLQVSVQHGTAAAVVVGMITLGASGGGELELDSQNGDSVPAVQKGDMISVSNGGTAILAGVF